MGNSGGKGKKKMTEEASAMVWPGNKREKGRDGNSYNKKQKE